MTGLDKSKPFGYILLDGSLVSQQISGIEQSGVSPASNDGLRADVLALYQRLLPAQFLERVRQEENSRENNRVYGTAVVIWLMIAQRLQGNGTLETAVMELRRGLPASFWPSPCKRLRQEEEGPKLSSHTGAYNKARRELPVWCAGTAAVCWPSALL